jgi:hypothetical protein
MARVGGWVRCFGNPVCPDTGFLCEHYSGRFTTPEDVGQNILNNPARVLLVVCEG